MRGGAALATASPQMARHMIPDPSRAPGSFPASQVSAPDRSWDLLLICVAGYIATAVGRIHELFPALLVLRPTFVAAALATGDYIVHQVGPRRIDRLHVPSSSYVNALLISIALVYPCSLYPS